jgi:hypothetical protein
MREGQGCDLKAEEERKPRRVRLKPIDRQQMMLRPVDVESLVPEDHEV